VAEKDQRSEGENREKVRGHEAGSGWGSEDHTDTEYEATEKLVEDRIEERYHLTQELDQELSDMSARAKKQGFKIQVTHG